MNKIILLLVLLQIVSTLSRVCNTDETCVALFECPELMHSSLKVRTQNRCEMPRKYCCPAKSMGMIVKMSNEPKFPEDCGSTPMYANDRVVGGRGIEPDEFSWLVSLEYAYRGGTSGICGGSIINSRYVLTAAHCVMGKQIKDELGAVIAVRLGDFRNGQKCDYGTSTCPHYQRIEIEEITVHWNYLEHGNMLNDISLIRLKQMITFTDILKPICLPIGHNKHIVEPTAGTWLTVSGWGRTSSLNDFIAKRAVSIPLWEKSKCLSDTRRDDSQICADNNGMGSCHGDSGGPVMYRFANKRMVLEGIVSYGVRECATASFPGVYTRVRSFDTWIETNIKM